MSFSVADTSKPPYPFAVSWKAVSWKNVLRILRSVCPYLLRLRGEIFLRAVFAQPAFALWELNRLAELYQIIFASLSSHGLQLSDMKMEQGAGSLGDVQFSCFLKSFNGAVRLRLDRVEIQSFDDLRVTQ